jgi:hypothetical protein
LTAPLEPELAPFEHARKCFRVDVRVSTPQLDDWLSVTSDEVSLFDAQHIFRVWCRRIRRGTMVGREYKGSAVRVRFVDERGALTVVQWGEPGPG